MRDSSHNAIVNLLLKVPSGFKARIREFSGAECVDFSMPLHLTHSFLMDAEYTPENVKDLSRFRNSAEFEAVCDIVRSAPMNEYLTIEVDTGKLAFASTISREQRIELSRYLASKTGGIG